MVFDWTISLGNVLTLVGFVGGGIAFIYAVRRDVDVLTARLKPLETAIGELTEALTVIARQDERVKALERDRDAGYPGKQRRKAGPW